MKDKQEVIQEQLDFGKITQETITDITKNLRITKILKDHKCHIPTDILIKQDEIVVLGHAIAKGTGSPSAEKFYSKSLEDLVKNNKYPSHVAKELVESFETE
jgi:hypothetical protein